MDLFRKTYEIFGMVEKSCVFRVGSGFIRAEFKHGSLATSGIIPATFTTSDQVIQCAIEASDKFKNNVVKLGKSVKIGEIQEIKAPSDAPKQPAGNDDKGEGGGEAGGNDDTGKGSIDYPDVATGQAARAILSVEPYNVSMARLQRNDEIRVVALEVGVTFSNWK